MKQLLQVISFCSLAAVVVVAGAFFTDALNHEAAKMALLWSALAWFATVPFWMDHRA